jgi:hypothetical protein
MMPVSLAKIRYDEDCQSRVRLDEETVAEYAHRMKEGATFPAITVFFDGSEHWLADGYHRFAAAKVVAREAGDDAAEIKADIQQGTRLDAVRHALAANSQHGKRREPGDYRKGYEIAVRCQLCEATDTAAVRELLACSERWARDLTAAARDAAERERNARIAAAAAAGEPQRAIAEREGMSQRGIGKVLENKRQYAASSQTDVATVAAQEATVAASTVPPPPPTPPIPSARTFAQGPGPYLPLPGQPAPLPSAIARLSDPASIQWSDLMTRIGDVIAAMKRAYQHDCPEVMATKAAALLTELEEFLPSIKEGLFDDDAE